jgi:hypothetical protein
LESNSVENKMKTTCPIISGNPRYFGLTQIEWALALFIVFFITIIPSPYSYFGFMLWIVGVIAYPKVSKKFEENFISVLLESIKIPATLIGQIRRAIPPLNPK